MSDDNKAASPNRRDFLKTTIVGAVGAAMLTDALVAQAAAAPTAVELEEITVAALQQGMAAGHLTSRSIVEKYIARINAIDKHGPTLNAVIELNPEAMAIADSLDKERKAGKVRGPLHGIPVLIKDNIATADKMQTTAGSLALVGSKPAKDSAVAARLREAGAVILGKTNLSEWANFRSSHATSGWSGRGGLTLNPYALDRNPSGSSSGSGVAVAASLCTLAVGSETDGSIVSPSSNNGIVGIKPTVGLVSRTGIIPISHTQDTAGPMARTVADAAALLSVLAGADPSDEATHDAAAHIERDYTRFLDAKALHGARIGVVRKYAGYSDAVDHQLDLAIAAMKSAGAEIIDPVEIPTLGKFDDAETEVLLYEFKADLNAYLAALTDSPVRTLTDVIAFNEKNREREMPYFAQELFHQAEKKGPLTSPEYLKALEQCGRMSRAEGADALMDKNRLDALIAPTNGPAWVTDLINGDHFTGSSTTLAAVAGYPNINVPMGDVSGMPVGISFFGRKWSEPKLIALAYAYEQATKLRKAPRFLPTVKFAKS